MKNKLKHSVFSDKRFRDLARYYCVYTLLFIAICFVVFHPFIGSEKSLIWKIDGVPQYMLWLQYTGRYLRQLIKQILTGTVTIPMYDFHIGMGNDIRNFFKTEPMQFMGIFLIYGTRGTSKLYNLLTILRIYLIGISFSCYGFYLKQEHLPVLAGSLTYTFSTYTFYQVERHPQFVVAAIMLPLLLIGLEQVMRQKSFLFFSFIVAVSLMASYYFLYMNTLIMGIYALLRFPGLCRKDRVRGFLSMCQRIILSYLLGCGMATIFFIPSVASFFLSARSSGGNKASAIGSFLTYGKYRPVSLFLSLIAPIRQSAALTTISTGILTTPALVLMFTDRKKKNRVLIPAFLLGLLFLMVPFFGYVFSGFSTVNNRWSFGFVFLIAVIVITYFSAIYEISLAEYIILAAVNILYGLAVYIRVPNNRAYLLALFMLTATTILIGLVRLLPIKNRTVSGYVLILILCVSAALNGYYMNSQKYGNLVNEFQNEATANNYFVSSRYKLLGKIEDDSFYRNDTDMMFNNYNNVPVALGYNGISLYNSTIGSNTISYYKETENTGISALNRTLFLDNRTAQEALACVKYFITFKNNAQNVPYGFELDQDVSGHSDNYDVYKNKYILPVGYNYDQVVSQSEYDKLSGLEKQEVQLNAAVIPDKELKDFSDFPSADPSTLLGAISKGTFTITGIDEGIVKKGNTYKVTRIVPADWVPENDAGDPAAAKNPQIHFTTSSKRNCEVYLRLKGVSYSKKIRKDINVFTDKIKKRAIIRNKADTYGLGMTDYLVNLGYYHDTEVINGHISFSGIADYTIEDFEVYYVSMDTYKDSIANLKKDALTDITFSTNMIEAESNTGHKRVIAFSVPYHVGWSAFIDGEKTKLYRLNTLYMGIVVPEGAHRVTLKYHSPGIRIGIAITVLCWYVFLLLLVMYFQKKREKSRNKNR